MDVQHMIQPDGQHLLGLLAVGVDVGLVVRVVDHFIGYLCLWGIITAGICSAKRRKT